MRIIISPAKKMREDTDSFACRGLPVFLSRTSQLLTRLREMSEDELKSVWKCNDKIAALNIDRLQNMDLKHGLTPAILSYEGIQYQYMAPGVFTAEALEYVQEHLRILSGFYGVLRPFDGVRPYRLEMQSKFNICNVNNLYSYWGNLLSDEIYQETDCVINLASYEYSQCISKYRPPDGRFITCIFAEYKGEKLIEKGTLCKMARGEMVRYMAENRITEPEEIQNFDRMDYRFSVVDSDEHTYTFIKEEPEHA